MLIKKRKGSLFLILIFAEFCNLSWASFPYQQCDWKNSPYTEGLINRHASTSLLEKEKVEKDDNIFRCLPQTDPDILTSQNFKSLTDVIKTVDRNFSVAINVYPDTEKKDKDDDNIDPICFLGSTLWGGGRDAWLPSPARRTWR